MSQCRLLMPLVPAAVLLGLLGSPSRCDTPVTPAEQAAEDAPTADQALGACAYAYGHLKSYRCRIREVDLADGKSNGSSTADIWFQYPDHLRVEGSEIDFISGPKPHPSIYLSDGKTGREYADGKWRQTGDFNQAYLIAPAGKRIPELLLNGDGGNIGRMAAFSKPQVASGVVNGRDCWQVTTGASINDAVGGAINAKSTHGSISSLNDRATLSIDKQTFLLDRYESVVTINGAHLDNVQTITQSQPNAPVASQLFVYSDSIRPN